LEVEPTPKIDAGLDIDLLFDHSGSMSERAAGDREIAASKFEVARDALAAVARDRLKGADRIRLWQFNDTVDFVGAASGKECNALVGRLSETGGGTEIGRAFDAVIAQRRSKDVLIVTDGKSWAFDPQKVARSGLRVTAVLIGEDALEAGIAHLAGMTGGQAFIAAGSDAGTAIAAALEAARVPHQPLAPIADTPSRVEVLRRGARLVASWGEKAQGETTAEARLIGATAAMLAIPGMTDVAAAKLAEAEGIVCHLTSLVLVDEAGVRHEGIPASRKVELMAPLAAAMPVGAARVAAACYEPEVDARSRSSGMSSGRQRGMLQRLSSLISESRAAAPTRTRPASPPTVDLGDLIGLIDWDADPEALRRGDLSDLPMSLVMAIQAAARLPEIAAFARTLGIDPVVAVVALLARAAGRSNRSAQRLARTILGRAQAADLETAMHEVGL
jgi:hypothetical protein